MKNVIRLIASVFLFIILFSNVSATSTKYQIFKELAITTSQVEEDYGAKYNNALDKYFIKIRYYEKDRELKELENKLEPILKKYSNKSYLSINERKRFNLLQNIYYRSKILSMYYID